MNSHPLAAVSIISDIDIKIAGQDFVEILPLSTMTVPPYTTTNAVFFGTSRFVVIDPGSSDTGQQNILKQYIEARLNRGQQLLAVLLTHHHGDHVSAGSFVNDEFSVPILAHKNASRHLNFSITGLEDQATIDLGPDSYLTAIYTPGHADDHLVYFHEPTGILAAGDMITEKGTVLIPPGNGSLNIYIESLSILARLPIKTIIPAHGAPIHEKPIQFLLKAIKHRYERIAGVLKVVANNDVGMIDATDITMLVYGGTIPDNLIFFAQLSVESSLKWLEEHGLVRKENYKWLAEANVHEIMKTALLDPMAELDRAVATQK